MTPKDDSQKGQTAEAEKPNRSASEGENPNPESVQESTAPAQSSDEQNGQPDPEAERAALAESQNAPGSVPEQRPQASGRRGADSEGTLHRTLRERGALPDQEPMDQEAYDRADSDKQRKAAAKDEAQPNIDGAARVKVIKGDHEGRFGAIVDVTYTSAEEHAKATSGIPAAKQFAEVSHYTIRTRDGRHELLSVKPDEIRRASVAEYAPVT